MKREEHRAKKHHHRACRRARIEPPTSSLGYVKVAYVITGHDKIKEARAHEVNVRQAAAGGERGTQRGNAAKHQPHHEEKAKQAAVGIKNEHGEERQRQINQNERNKKPHEAIVVKQTELCDEFVYRQKVSPLNVCLCQILRHV